MRNAPNYTAFTLSSPLCGVPAGATGQLIRLDSYHVALNFDEAAHDDLVFDVYDTDPAVWAAVSRQHRVGWCPRALVAAALVLLAFSLGWLAFPQPDRAHAAIESFIADYSGVF